MLKHIPPKVVERLVVYRRLLQARVEAEVSYIYSHELAALAHVTAVQVRRDLMVVGNAGNPRRGYDVAELAERIGVILDAPNGQKAALVGVGNVGRSLLTYFSGRNPKITVAAAFDSDPMKIGRVIAGCRCYDIQDLSGWVRELGITIGIVTVPGPQAQAMADTLVDAFIQRADRVYGPDAGPGP